MYSSKEKKREIVDNKQCNHFKALLIEGLLRFADVAQCWVSSQSWQGAVGGSIDGQMLNVHVESEVCQLNCQSRCPSRRRE